MGLCEPHEVQQGEVQGSARGLCQSQTQVQAGRRVAQVALRRRTWGVLVDEQLNMGWPRALAAQKANHNLAASREAWPAG